MSTDGTFSGPERTPMITSGMPSQLVDVDPEESAEWRESFDALLEKALSPLESEIPGFFKTAGTKRIGTFAVLGTLSYVVPCAWKIWSPSGNEAGIFKVTT